MKGPLPVIPAALVAGLWLSAPAEALPKFAQKENKPCAYCHVNPKGGGGRNARGQWYKAHGLSFRGYTEKAAPRKPNQTKNQPKKKVKR